MLLPDPDKLLIQAFKEKNNWICYGYLWNFSLNQTGFAFISCLIVTVLVKQKLKIHFSRGKKEITTGVKRKFRENRAQWGFEQASFWQHLFQLSERNPFYPLWYHTWYLSPGLKVSCSDWVKSINCILASYHWVLALSVSNVVPLICQSPCQVLCKGFVRVEEQQTDLNMT